METFLPRHSYREKLLGADSPRNEIRTLVAALDTSSNVQLIRVWRGLSPLTVWRGLGPMSA